MTFFFTVPQHLKVKCSLRNAATNWSFSMDYYCNLCRSFEHFSKFRWAFVVRWNYIDFATLWESGKIMQLANVEVNQRQVGKSKKKNKKKKR